MKRKNTKRLLAVLLSAVMLVSTAFTSLAAPAGKSGGVYDRPEVSNTAAVKTTGTWAKAADGAWTLDTGKGLAANGWFYTNVSNNSTEYGWFHFNEKSIMSTGWVQDGS